MLKDTQGKQLVQIHNIHDFCLISLWKCLSLAWWDLLPNALSLSGCYWPSTGFIQTLVISQYLSMSLPSLTTENVVGIVQSSLLFGAAKQVNGGKSVSK